MSKIYKWDSKSIIFMFDCMRLFDNVKDLYLFLKRMGNIVDRYVSLLSIMNE